MSFLHTRRTEDEWIQSYKGTDIYKDSYSYYIYIGGYNNTGYIDFVSLEEAIEYIDNYNK